MEADGYLVWNISCYQSFKLNKNPVPRTEWVLRGEFLLQRLLGSNQLSLKKLCASLSDGRNSLLSLGLALPKILQLNSTKLASNVSRMCGKEAFLSRQQSQVIKLGCWSWSTMLGIGRLPS
jgi:hypothetical protein